MISCKRDVFERQSLFSYSVQLLNFKLNYRLIQNNLYHHVVFTFHCVFSVLQCSKAVQTTLLDGGSSAGRK